MKWFQYLLVTLFLTSCAGSPAYAQDGCLMYKEVAREVMIVRQAGEPLELLLEGTKKMLADKKVPVGVQQNVIDITVSAYKIPYMEDKDQAVRTVMLYSNAVYNHCKSQMPQMR